MVGIRVRIGAQCTLFFFILLSGLHVTLWLIQGPQAVTFTACPSQHTTRTETVDHSVAAVGGLMIALLLTLTGTGKRGTGRGIPSSVMV